MGGAKTVEPKPGDAGPDAQGDTAKADNREVDGTIANSTKAIELKPDDAEAYVKRGIAKLAKNDLDGAMADSTKAIELKPDDAEAYVNRGVAQLAKGNSDAAIADFTKAVALNPDDAIGHYFLGFCYANGAGVKKDAVAAVRMYRKAAEQNLAQAQWSLGLCYYKGEGVARNAIEAYAWLAWRPRPIRMPPAAATNWSGSLPRNNSKPLKSAPRNWNRKSQPGPSFDRRKGRRVAGPNSGNPCCLCFLLRNS